MGFADVAISVRKRILVQETRALNLDINGFFTSFEFLSVLAGVLSSLVLGLFGVVTSGLFN
ncbi:MAG: hypothetical protein IID36_08625 [Planctomycetes bacterium]|nr:hypothetical protein [Planctomycetota bacterium]